MTTPLFEQFGGSIMITLTLACVGWLIRRAIQKLDEEIRAVRGVADSALTKSYEHESRLVGGDKDFKHHSETLGEIKQLLQAHTLAQNNILSLLVNLFQQCPFCHGAGKETAELLKNISMPQKPPQP